MALTWSGSHPTITAWTNSGREMLLRPWNSSDADAVYEACQDPDIVRWTTVPSPYTREHAAGFTGSSGSVAWDRMSGVHFAVTDAATGAVLASCGLVDVDHSDSTAEVGYWVAPWARRQGVATAATRAVTWWATTDLGARRVSLEAAAGNYGSQQVAADAGFTREGVHRSKAARFDERYDMVMFSFLPGDRAGDRTGGIPPWPAIAPVSGSVRLRKFHDHDVSMALDLSTDPYVPPIGTLPARATRAEALSWVQRQRHRHIDGAGFSFAIADLATDRALGGIGLWVNDLGEGRATAGYSIAPKERGKNIATTALTALTEFAWSIPQLHRVGLSIEPWNTASIRVAERAGYLREGLLRNYQEIDGTRRDMLLYAAVRDCWPAP